MTRHLPLATLLIALAICLAFAPPVAAGCAWRSPSTVEGQCANWCAKVAEDPASQAACRRACPDAAQTYAPFTGGPCTAQAQGECRKVLEANAQQAGTLPERAAYMLVIQQGCLGQ